MIDILKASAGSGKTFNLAKTYIRILLTSTEEHPYRHILAVTFTNKATAEMKSRILKELSVLATRPEESGYHADFVPALFPDSAALQQRAEALLIDILHDYSAFSISTIDRFFQQTLKAFSREIGQFSSYQIELDRKSLVRESIDRILDSLSEEKSELKSWLDDTVMEQLEQGRKVNLEENLYKVAERISSEERRTMETKLGIDSLSAFSKENIASVRKACSAVISSFIKDVREAARRAVDAFSDAGISLEDTNRKFLMKLQDYAVLETGTAFKKPTEAFLRNAADPDKWFAKSKAGTLLPRLAGSTAGLLDDFCRLWDVPYKVYFTADLLRKQTHALGLAAEFQHELEALMKEKNVLGIEDSNSLLKDIIDGSDAPFVYEKLGVRFENFLLDEFQDTSDVQWQNFRPLLKESNDNGRENLVVGDVKQSIYRFRQAEPGHFITRVSSSFSSNPASIEETSCPGRSVVIRVTFFSAASAVFSSPA